jgi:hypothetical protein
MMVRAVALRAGKAGLFTRLNAREIPAGSEVLPQAVLADNLGVAMLLDSVDIMYDSTKVSSPISSWLDLWRPEFKGKIALPAMPLAGYVTLTLLGVARTLGGGERNVEDAFKKIKELRPSVRAFVTDPNQASQLMERSEILAAPQYSARISNVMKANAHVARATPKEGVPAAPYDLMHREGIAQPGDGQALHQLRPLPEDPGVRRVDDPRHAREQEGHGHRPCPAARHERRLQALVRGRGVCGNKAEGLARSLGSRGPELTQSTHR